MLPAAIKDRSPLSLPYQRHRPEQTLLYQIIERHYPEFRDVMAMQGKTLSTHVQQEFADYLNCGRLEHGFMRVQCALFIAYAIFIETALRIKGHSNGSFRVLGKVNSTRKFFQT